MEKGELRPDQNKECDLEPEFFQGDRRTARRVADDQTEIDEDEVDMAHAIERNSLNYVNMSQQSSQTVDTKIDLGGQWPRLESLPEVENEEEQQFDEETHNYVNDTGVDCIDQNESKAECEEQLYLLRDLLAIERANNKQRHRNNLEMKRYLQQLQDDYLRLQSDLMQALEFGHKLKAQKESQIGCLEKNLEQKDELVQQLTNQLSNLDEAKLRAEFRAAFDKQQELHRLEEEQLRQQISIGEQQLCRERVSNSHLLQQFQEKLEDQLRLHETEVATIKTRLDQSQKDLERVLTEPQNLVVKALREDKARLESQIDELSFALEDTRNKYDSMRKRLDHLLLDQEHLAQENQEELARLQQLSADQRKSLQESKLELDDKQEVIQLLDFNLQRSEKRVKNLLAALKNKEASYRGLISQSETNQRQELEKAETSLRAAEKRLAALESELSAKQNEIVRLRLEQENQLESLRNDRDERLNKMSVEKTALFKELQATELKLARESGSANQQAQVSEQLQKEVQQFKEESKRLSIELTRCEAKLHAKQQELQIAMKTLDERAAEQTIDIECRNVLSLVKRELDEERGHSKRLKTNIDTLKKDKEKLCAKLRIAELNLDKTRSVINQEHEKMMREYEKKIESFRSEQALFDRNKQRYKCLGFKLKKYCEHLERVHQHLCNPNNCGYIVGPNLARHEAKRNSVNRSEFTGLLDSDGYDQISDK